MQASSLRKFGSFRVVPWHLLHVPYEWAADELRCSTMVWRHSRKRREEKVSMDFNIVKPSCKITLYTIDCSSPLRVFEFPYHQSWLPTVKVSKSPSTSNILSKIVRSSTSGSINLQSGPKLGRWRLPWQWRRKGSSDRVRLQNLWGNSGYCTLAPDSSSLVCMMADADQSVGGSLFLIYWLWYLFWT